MPKLNEIPRKTDLHTVLLFGPPKVGKTRMVGKLAELGYTLWYFDIEQGGLTLRQVSPEGQARINLFQIKDAAENSYAAKTLSRVINFRSVGPQLICQAHGLLNCASCKKEEKPFDTFQLEALGPADIVVIDSLTQLSDSYLNWSLGNQLEKKPEFDHWRDLQVKLDSLIDAMKTAPCHFIVITHEQSIETESGKEKLSPVGGSRNYANSLPRQFAHVIYCTIHNKEHAAFSRTTYHPGIVTGSRLDVDVALNAGKYGTPLAAIFPPLM